MSRLAGIALIATALAACASAPVHAQQPPHANPPMNAIQPETTITLNGKGAADRAPDKAIVSVGVQVEGKTASEAMRQQAQLMDGVFKAVRAAGIADRDMQTSNLSLNPVYDYRDNGAVLRGYSASNQISITVRDLRKLGQTLDSIVNAGGNTINGVMFGVEDDQEARDEARIEAITDAQRKAEVYARAVGYRVERIVTIVENEFDHPQPVPMMARNQMGDSEAATAIAGGEVTLESSVNVTFELRKR